MLTINILQISSNEKSIEISIETNQGDTINSATLWTDKTFKDYTKSKSLNSYLKQTNNKEVFTVPISEVGEAKIYFIEFTATNVVSVGNTCTNNNDFISLGVVANLGYFQECLLENILKVNYNTEDVLNSNEINKLVNTKVLIDGLTTSIKFGYYAEAIDLLNGLRKICKNTSQCISCNSLTTPVFSSGVNIGRIENKRTLA